MLRYDALLGALLPAGRMLKGEYEFGAFYAESGAALGTGPEDLQHSSS
mgnify:FL=1